MRSVLRLGLALALIWTFVPGSMEFLESAVHIAQHGHTAHADVAEHDHTTPSAEHGCTPAAHTCGCCRVSFDVSTPVPSLGSRALLMRARTYAAGPSPSEHVLTIDHPPRA